jgi:hypothetical protein
MMFLHEGKKVRVLRNVEGYDAAPGEYIVEKFVTVSMQIQASNGLPIIGERREPFYFLHSIPYDGCAYAAPADVVIPVWRQS